MGYNGMLKQSAEHIADVIVVGAGIVGAACARELADRGFDVTVIDAACSSATNAGMGHLVSVDGSPEELALCAYSLDLWRELAPTLAAQCAYVNCGTLWLAETQQERAAAEAKQAALARQGIASDWLDTTALAQEEPMLRHGLAGALRVASDSIVYAPATARWLLNAARKRPAYCQARVTRLGDHCVQIDDDRWLAAERIVLANGLGANALLPELQLVAKKGQLAITDRYPRAINHQLVELAYSQQAHAATRASVAFNVQPRPTGQILIGSSRQLDDMSAGLDNDLLGRMLRRATDFLPELAHMTAIRAWTGLRAATADGLPLIGAWPGHPGLWLALGHEGHGVTTSLGTARLLADMVCNQTPAIDPTAYEAARIAPREATA